MNQLTSMQQINVNKIHKANQTNQIKIGRKYSMKTKQTSPPLIVVCLCKFVRWRRQWKPQREVRRVAAGTRRWRWTSAVQTRVPTHRIEGKGASEELPRLMGKEGWRAASAEGAESCQRVSRPRRVQDLHGKRRAQTRQISWRKGTAVMDGDAWTTAVGSGGESAG